MTKKRSVRLDDVAAAAGVHTSTVSRVLNNEADHRVSTETRERVLIAAKELNYHANAMARRLDWGDVWRSPKQPGGAG